MRLALISFLPLMALACGASTVSVTAPDAPADEGVPAPDVPVMPDADVPSPRLTARLSASTAPAQEVAPNVTGLLAAAFEVTAPGEAVPVRSLRFRRVGVGNAADVANAYLFAVPGGSRSGMPFRYSTARAVNPLTGRFEYAFDNRVQAGATTTILVFVDLNASSAGGQHAIELIEAVTDRETIAFPAVRGFPVTIGARRAVRLGIRPGPALGPATRDVASVPVASFRLVGGASLISVPSLMFILASGSVGMRADELRDLELWRGRERIPLIEWDMPFNGTLFLVPSLPLEVPPDVTADYVVRGRVTAPVGSRIRAYVEYPSDVRARDVARNERAATCISAIHTIGCDGPDQANFDGSSEAAMSVVTVVP